MKEIKWGIIGCGNVTEVKSGPAFWKVKNSSLVAVMRRDSEKARDYALRNKVPKWYDDAERLINDPDVNAIYIATPPLYHEQYAIAALWAGKPVYVEKPMSIDADAAKRMKLAAVRYGVKLCVAHYRRQQPLFVKIKQLLDSGYIGKPKFINLLLLQPPDSRMAVATPANWRVDPAVSGGGLFHDLAPHQLDLMLFFFGAPLYASGVSANQAALYPADDITSGSILFKNNILFNGLWCFTVPAGEAKDSCEIIGTEGRISFSVFHKPQINILRNGKEEQLDFEPIQHVQQPMIEKVVEYFSGGTMNPCSADDGVEVMQIIDAFTKKA